jgi:hypothetical protein
MKATILETIFVLWVSVMCEMGLVVLIMSAESFA